MSKSRESSGGPLTYSPQTYSRQRSDMIIEDLRKEIDSINQLIRDSRIMMGQSEGKITRIQKVPHQGGRIQNGSRVENRHQNSAWSGFSRDRGNHGKFIQRNVYQTPDRSTRIETLTRSAQGNHHEPHIVVNVRYQTPDPEHHQRGHKQLRNSPYHNFENQFENEKKHLIQQLHRNQGAVNQLSHKQKELITERKKRQEAQSLLERNKIENKMLKSQLHQLEHRGSSYAQRLKSSLLNIQKEVKQNKDSRLHQNNRQTRTGSDYNGKKRTDYPYHNRKDNLSPSHHHSYLQDHAHSKVQPRHRDLETYKIDKHKRLVVTLGSKEKKKQRQYKKDHPYLCKHASHLSQSRHHHNYLNYKPRANTQKNNKSLSLDYSVGKSKQDNRVSNDKLKQLCRKRLAKLEHQKRKIDGQITRFTSPNKSKTPEFQSRNKSLSRLKTKAARPVKGKFEYQVRSKEGLFDRLSDPFAVRVSSHNCEVNRVKTCFEEMILPDKPPTRQEFKNAVLKHYVVERYLNDEDLNQVYTQVCHGNIPRHEWPILAMDLAFLKVHHSRKDINSTLVI